MALIGYARVSIDEQTVRSRIDELRAAGCTRIHEEHASGGSRARPVLAQVLRHLVVVRLDRLARSLSHLLEVLKGLEGKGAHQAVEGKVDVFGEALDGAIDLRERGSSLEDQSRPLVGRGEQPPERPADPEILLDNRRREAAPRRRLVEEFGAFRSRGLRDRLYQAAGAARRSRIGRIQPGAWIASRATARRSSSDPT